MENHGFFNVFPVSEVSEQQGKPSRGGAAPGLSARILNACKLIDV